MKHFLFLFCFFYLFTSGIAQEYPNVQYNEDLKQVFIFADRKPMVKVNAPAFSFHPELIVAQNATVTIYLYTELEVDSIYHPFVDFNYNPTTTELWVTRDNHGLGRTPFYDSYHKLEIRSDAIFWKMNTPVIEFKEPMYQTLNKSAFFQSQDFFDPEIMRRNKGYNDKSPMLHLWELFKANDFQPISLRNITTSFRSSYPDIKSLMLEYAVQRLVEYDLENDIIHYRRKLAHYLNNESKRRDYDNLYWESKSHSATLDIRTFDLIVLNCEFFVLSDANIVNVYPANERVTVKKNRNLHFTGRVIGGLFDFAARDCTFDYDKFQIFMPQIDSIIIFSEDKSRGKDLYGDYPLKRVKNVIEEVSGTLFIDDPQNKSSNKDFPDYPIFESHGGGKVFYNQKFILDGEYKREVFYFMLDYFKIKNLDNFDIAITNFPGRLVSGGIFPDIHEPLKLQPDNSLGFVHRTGEAGLPMYEGNAQFFNTITLTNSGLRGNGKIEYLTSTTESDSLVFYLQSVRGKANSFHLRPQLAGIEYPEASTTFAQLFFEPYKEMRVTSAKSPFVIFDECKFEGTLALSPQNLKGNGVLNFKRAELESKSMTLKHHAVEAEKSNLRIFEDEKVKKYVFIAENYGAKIDFNKRVGEFVSPDNASEIRFIANGFKTNAQKFTWNTIDENVLRFLWTDPYGEVNIDATPSRELVKMNSTGNILSTIEQGRRAISFNLRELDFDFEHNTLAARGVRYIPVGDAAIIPKNGSVTIYENAVFSHLSNTRILASRDNMYHELYNASVQIENGDDFRGNGYYDYIDAFNRTQTLRFDTVWHFRTTKGNAVISPEADFTFSPHFGFSGSAELNSAHEFLTFSGGTTMLHDCSVEKRQPLRISQQINPENILIQINEKSRDIKDRKATVTIASANKTGRIYTCFGAAKDQINDSEYITASGFITYDTEKQAFVAASLNKLKNPQHPGNIISLYNKDCITIGEGAIDMGAKLGRIKFNTHGQVVNYMRLDSAAMNLTTSIDFFFNDEAMKIMTDYFTELKDVKFVDPNTDQNYIQSLINILGQEEYEKFEKASKSGLQSGKLPPQLDVKFLFSTLNFTWSQANSAFESQKMLPLVIAGGKNIYKEIQGRIVVEKKGSKNTLFIYFEAGKEFFFFHFENNSLSGFSSDERFNNAIINTKAKDKTLSAKGGEPSFSYKVGNRGQKSRFTRKYF